MRDRPVPRGALPIFMQCAMILGVGGLVWLLCASVWFESQYRGLLQRGDRQAASLLAEGAARALQPFLVMEDYDGMAVMLHTLVSDSPCTDLLVIDGDGRVLLHLARDTPSGAVREAAGGRLTAPGAEGVVLIRPGHLRAWARVDHGGHLGWVRVEMLPTYGDLEAARMRGHTVAASLAGGAVLFLLIVTTLRRTYRLVDRREISLLETQRSLYDEVHHDRLTGLPNRLELMERLTQALLARRDSGRLLAVCFLDLDGFKGVNDRFGHAIGDLLLVEVAQRLQACVRDSDVVARLAGDEFVLLLEGEVRPGELHRLLDRVVMRVSAAFMMGDQRLQVGVSIGVALCDAADVSAETLLTQADEAMYQAKRSGRNRWVLHESVGGALFRPAVSVPVPSAAI